VSNSQRIESFNNRVSTATNPAQILTLVRGYLWAWPVERVRALQKMDGAWAPFGRTNDPQEIMSVLDLHRMAEALKLQCAALDEAAIVKAPELIELEACLSFADRATQKLGAPWGQAQDKPAHLARSAPLNKCRFSREQIISIIEQWENGMNPAQLARAHGIGETTLYNWKMRYSGLGPSQLRHRQEIADRNAMSMKPPAHPARTPQAPREAVRTPKAPLEAVE